MFSITRSNFLADWLRQHIKEDDMALIKYSTGRGPGQRFDED